MISQLWREEEESGWVSEEENDCKTIAMLYSWPSQYWY
jgi:hypothetical protein